MRLKSGVLEDSQHFNWHVIINTNKLGEIKMRKAILVGISFLLLACSTFSLKDLQGTSNTLATPVKPTPNETLVSLYVQATVLAAQTNPQNPIQAPTPATGCTQLPCPTQTPSDVTSPILPAPPTITVPNNGNITRTVPILSEMPTPTPTLAAGKPYQVQANTPIYLSNFAHQDLACNWMGVAGQVFDVSGNPAKNIIIIADGNLNGTHINSIGMTGMTSLYGPGGFEIVLSNKPAASSGTLTLTVYGNNGLPLSDPVPFNTVGDCQKNLTLINFQQVR